MAIDNSRKSVRLHILVDQQFKNMVDQAAHESWMSVGQYIREIVALLDGANYDTSSDLIMIGKEVGLEGLEQLRSLAERRGLSVKEYCESLAKFKPAAVQSTESEKDINQMDLFQ